MNENEEIRRIKEKKLHELLKIRSENNMEKKTDYPTSPIIVKDDTFQDFVQRYPVVVVDCWAEWCGPCRMVGPVIEELAKDFAGKVVFGKLNVDENQITATKFGIMSIPSLLVFKNGELIDKIIGAMPKEMLKAKLANYE